MAEGRRGSFFTRRGLARFDEGSGNNTNNAFTRPNFVQTKKDKAIIRSFQPVPNQQIISDSKSKKPIKKPAKSSFSTTNKILDTLTNKSSAKVTQKPVVILDRADRELKQIPPDNFSTQGEITLNGEYKQNEIRFDRFTFSEIKAYDTVSFQFILQIADNSGVKYFTSKNFLGKLQTANKRSEPYLPLEALSPASIVRVDLRQSLNGLDELRILEQKDGANISFNTYVDINGTIDYQRLVEYIDFIVSKPPEEYDNRIISAESLGKWTIDESVKYGDDEDTGGGTIIPPSEENKDDNNSTPPPPPPPPPPPQNDPEPLPLGEYKPIGRAGNYIGEIVDRPSGNYRWDGARWNFIDINRGGNGSTEEPGGPNVNTGGQNKSGGDKDGTIERLL